MDFEEFRERLMEDLKDNLQHKTGKEFTAEANHVKKLQDAGYDGIVIRPEGESVGVTLDAQEMFKALENGKSYDEVMEHATEIAVHGFENQPAFNIFDEWCSFLNFFDSSIHFELSFMNKTADEEESRKQIDIPHANDGFDSVRDEYSGMLKNQLSRGNNGIVKKKYVTFGIEASKLSEAKPKLNHIESSICNNFKKMGVSAHSLNGKERLEVMHC